MYKVNIVIRFMAVTETETEFKRKLLRGVWFYLTTLKMASIYN